MRRLGDPFEQAMAYCCFATRAQFYFDGNKRTSRNMMNGHLMINGMRTISIPAAARAEYDHALDRLFRDGDANPHMDLLNRARMDIVAEEVGIDVPGAKGAKRSWVPAHAEEGAWIKGCWG